MLEIVAAGVVVGVASIGAAVVLRRSRKRKAADRETSRRDALSNAHLEVHHIRRLSLADAAAILPADFDMPYVFQVELTVILTAPVEWRTSDLDLVSDLAETDDHAHDDVRLLTVSPSEPSVIMGSALLELTIRSRRPSPMCTLLCDGTRLGSIETFRASVTTTQRIPKALHAQQVVMVVEPLPDDAEVDVERAPAPIAAEDVAAVAARALAAARAAVDEPPAATAILGGSSVAPRRARVAAPAPRVSAAPLGSVDAVAAFTIYSPLGDRFDPPPIDGLDVEALTPIARASAPDRFALELLLRACAEPPSGEVISTLREAHFIHQVIVRRRAEGLSHLAEALTTASSLAIECHGVIYDEGARRFMTPDQARRILKSRRFAISDHVSTATTTTGATQFVRTRGMAKLGVPDLAAADVPKEHVRLVRQALLTLADLRALGPTIQVGSAIQLGPSLVTLAPGPDGLFVVTDADPFTGAARGGLARWIDAVGLARV